MPSTVLPGQPGTFAVSDHRTTDGAPFDRLNELRSGDRILLLTRAGRTSPPRRTQIVLPTDSWVLDCVRGPGGKPNPTITLTTCHPPSARQRLIVFGDLTASIPSAAPRPPRLPGQRAKRHRRSELVTTLTLDNAIAAPATIGLSRPTAASGIAAVL